MSEGTSDKRERARPYFESAREKEASGDTDGAIHDYTAAMTVDESWPQPCVARGSIYFRQGRVDEAIGDFTRAIRHDPGYVRAYAKRGAAYLGKRDYGAAVNDLTKALEAAPGHAKLLALRLEARLASGQGWAALDDANTLVEGHPDDASALYWRGLALEKVGDPVGAERDLREASSRGYLPARDVLSKRYGGV